MAQPKIAANQLDLGASTSAIKIPSGTTAQRPSSPTNGEIRYNTTLSGFEGYAGGSWAALTAGALTATLDDLTDVIITTPIANQILQYNGTNWVNVTASSPVAHNALSGFQGGSVGQYYHLTSAQNTTVAALSALSNGISAKTGAGTYSTRTITAPVAGISITNGDGIAGNPTLALTNDLGAIEGLTTNGLSVRTATDTWTTRTITAPVAGISITNGDGIAGNPTLVLVNDLGAVEGLTTNGLAVRTATDTWTTRTITGTTNQISINNGDGVANNPTISISSNVILPGTASVTLPSGTTAERGTASNGQMRYNTTLGVFEGYQSGEWTPLAPKVLDIPGNTSWATSINESSTIFSYVANEAFDLPIGLSGSNFYLMDASGNSGTKTFTIYHVVSGTPTSVGTIAYSTPYVTPTITFTSLVSVAVGDALVINGTSVGEGTITGILAFNIRGVI